MVGGLLMSNKLTKIIAISLAFFGMCLSGCNGTSGGDSHHTHTFSNQWSSDSTYHWHDSTCGHDVTSEKAAHTFNDVVTPATYDHGGYTTHTCSVCDYSYTDSETDQLVHHYSDAWSHNETHHWHACTDVGYEDLYEDMEGHSMSTSIISATDDEEGYTLHSCECGYSYKNNYTSAPNKFIYQLNSDETGYGVYGYEGLAKSLVVPSSHNSLPVLSIGYKGFMNYNEIESIVVPNSVTSLGVYAFSGCSSLKSLILSNSISEIRDNTFQNCSSLEELIIPNSVTSISAGSFSGCSSLESITLPFVGANSSDTVASESTLFGYIFGTSSYNGASAINQYYTTSDSVTYFIPSSLKNVTITNNDVLFGGLSYLKIKKLNFGPGVTSIAQRGVYFCSSLQNVDMSESNIAEFGSSAFSECSSLTNVVLPSSLQSLVAYAFYNCTLLQSISIPNGVDSIGYNAFKNCSSLSSIDIPNSVLSIGQSAFENCISMVTASIGSGVTTIGESAFANCKALLSITLGSSLETIGNNAFSGCNSLTTVNIPASVSSIGTTVFSGCNNLEYIGSDSENQYYFSDNGILYNKTKTTLIRVPAKYSGSVVIPNTVTSISSDAFNNCSLITSVVIPDSVSSLSSGLFTGCSSLESITLPFVGSSNNPSSASSSTLFGYIFGTANYQGGEAIKQYYSSSSNGYATYYIPSSLKNVTVTGGKLMYGALSYLCIETLSLGSNVSIVGVSTMYHCQSLVSVNLSSVSTTSLPNNTFGEDSSLSNLVLPYNLQNIGDSALCGCVSLTSINLPNTLTSIGGRAFERVPVTTISLPNGLKQLAHMHLMSVKS